MLDRSGSVFYRYGLVAIWIARQADEWELANFVEPRNHRHFLAHSSCANRSPEKCMARLGHASSGSSVPPAQQSRQSTAGLDALCVQAPTFRHDPSGLVLDRVALPSLDVTSTWAGHIRRRGTSESCARISSQAESQERPPRGDLHGMQISGIQISENQFI